MQKTWFKTCFCWTGRKQSIFPPKTFIQILQQLDHYYQKNVAFIFSPSLQDSTSCPLPNRVLLISIMQVSNNNDACKKRSSVEYDGAFSHLISWIECLPEVWWICIWMLLIFPVKLPICNRCSSNVFCTNLTPDDVLLDVYTISAFANLQTGLLCTTGTRINKLLYHVTRLPCNLFLKLLRVNLESRLLQNRAKSVVVLRLRI